MHLWLTHLPELRIPLRAGWYELPSHMPIEEVRRLLELLARAVPGVESIVECEWSQLDMLAPSPTALVFVSAPPTIAYDTLNGTLGLESHEVRLGLCQQPGARRWPGLAWDETQVKSPVVAAVRKSLRASTHPLAGIGIAELPIDLLAGSTSEPIELLLLVERTVELAAREHEGGSVDWDALAHQAIGQRLVQRLAGVEPRHRAAVRACLTSAIEGTLSTVFHRDEIEQLQACGLALAKGGDALLTPLARCGIEPRVAAMLEQAFPQKHDGLASADPEARTIARTPDEAFESFDPSIPVGPGDPWFVDLREYSPDLRRLSRFLRLHLLRRDRGYVIELAAEEGSGAGTMIGVLLRELEAEGLVSIDIRIETDDPDSADASLCVLSGVLHYCEAQPDILIADETLSTFEDTLRGASGSWGSLAVLPVDSVEVFASRVDEARKSHRLDPDKIGQITVDVLTQVRRQLGARGQSLCLHGTYDGPPGLPRLNDATNTHMLICVEPRAKKSILADEHLDYPNTADPDTLRAVLSARADLDAVFEDPELALEHLDSYSQCRIALVLEVAKQACAWTAKPKVSLADIEQAAKRLGEKM